MKRVRATGTVSQRRQLARTIGIDVDRDMLVCAAWRHDSERVPVREYPNDVTGYPALVEWAQAHGAELVCLESSGPYSQCVYDALCEAGLSTVCINPLTIKALLRVEGKSDRRDAATLARLAGSFDLRRSNMPDAHQRELRLLYRRIDEAHLQQIRIRAKLNAVLTAAGCPLMKMVSGDIELKMLDALGTMPGKMVAALHRLASRRLSLAAIIPDQLPAGVLGYKRSALTQLNLLRTLETDAQSELDAYIVSNADWLEPATRWMLTVPCTGRYMAVRVVAEMGANFTERYSSAERFCSALGVCPRSEVSGGKLLKTSDTHGNPRLLTPFVFSIKGYVRHLHGPLRGLWDSTRGRMGYARALLALAHLVAEGWYHCTAKQAPWDVNLAIGRRADLPTYTDAPTGEMRL